MNPYLIAGAAIAVLIAFGAGYTQGKSTGKAEVQQLWDRAVADQAQEHAKAVAAARAKEQAMQADADKLREDKDREIRTIAARNDALLSRLRERPSRPAAIPGGLPQASGAGQNPAICTGAELPREDGEFLAREAARADEIRTALKRCEEQYERVTK